MNSRSNESRLVTAFGVPSAFAYFCAHILQHLVRAVFKDFDHGTVADVEQLKAAIANRRHPSLLIFSDRPDRTIVNAYLKTNAPAMLIYDDPVDVVDFIMREHKMTAEWACRSAQQSIISLAPLFRSDQSLKISRNSAGTLEDFLREAADHFDLIVDDASIAEVCEALSRGGEINSNTPLEQAYTSLSPQTRPASSPDEPLDRSLAPFEPLITFLRRVSAGEDHDVFEWPIPLFVSGDFPGWPFRGMIEMTGPARCILYGPYLGLPAGRWCLCLTAKVKDNQSGNALDVDLSQPGRMVRQRFTLPASGRIEIRALIDSDEPRSSHELRLMIVEGAIEGGIEIERVTISRVSPTIEA